MALTFEWDNNKAKNNVEKHDVAFEEAATVFADSNSLTIDDPAHSVNEKRHITIGKSQSKRLLVVVYTERGDKIRIISARSASKKERQYYQQK